VNQEARLEAVVRGVVQGVGFRSFVEQEARSLELSGYVRNRGDGSVEVVAEGPKGLLEDLLAALKRGHLGAHVSGVDARWAEPLEEFPRFEIRV
jgi:acylphosphatase